jgi:3-phenylpropionate/trans-cinnamate dioxygenase ferredoxin reductase subunit
VTAFAIVGGGLAGAKAAETLREEGFDGRVVLIGEEPERPYERPPLSKGYLAGDAPRDTIHVHPETFYAEHDIELRTGVRATGIDGRELVLEGEERLRFDRLLLATGAAPRRLPLPALDGVLYLRTVADCDALRERLGRARSVVVVGAGWIGCEVAATARTRGLEVSVLDPLSYPLERVLGAELGSIYRDVHVDHGVRMRMQTGVEGFEGAGRVERVRTTAGDAIDCDLVVAGVGARPRGELLGTDAILVDERLETALPGVFAAGDVAAAWHPFYRARIRVEHWGNALEQGPAAARNMLGRGIAYDRLPYFFSDQYDVGMEYTGYAPAWDRIVFRGDPRAREFIAFWLAGDRVVAGMNVNVWDVVDPIQQLIRERVPVEDRALADPDVPLAELAHATR